MGVQWNRSRDGFIDSKCGRYQITPLYCGCVNPQAYQLWYELPDGKRTSVSTLDSTQRQAKEAADRHQERLANEQAAAKEAALAQEKGAGACVQKVGPPRKRPIERPMERSRR